MNPVSFSPARFAGTFKIRLSREEQLHDNILEAASLAARTHQVPAKTILKRSSRQTYEHSLSSTGDIKHEGTVLHGWQDLYTVSTTGATPEAQRAFDETFYEALTQPLRSSTHWQFADTLPPGKAGEETSVFTKHPAIKSDLLTYTPTP